MSERNYKILVVILLITIVVLSVFYMRELKKNSSEYPIATRNSNLLSPRVYSGILEPGSLLVFNFKPFEEGLIKYVRDNNLNASIFVENLRDGSSLNINEDKYFEPASLNKVPLAMIIMKKVDEGKLGLDNYLIIKDEDKDYSSGNVFPYSGNTITIRELLTHMLEESDNTAANVLLKQISQSDLDKFSYYTSFYDTGFFDKVNTQSMFNVFQSLYLSTFLSKDSSEFLLSLMAKSNFDINKYSNISNDIIISQKYAEYYKNNSKEYHDCGIIYDREKRLFYCVMTSGLSEEKGKKVIGEVVQGIVNYIDGVDSELKKIY